MEFEAVRDIIVETLACDAGQVETLQPNYLEAVANTL